MLTLSDLFAKDPKLLTETEIGIIVKEFENARDRWATEEREAKAQERKPRTKMGTSAAKALTIDDLGL